jgi:rfaE bifunctional protein nucleotidyltransferase chain/domain
LGQVVSQRELVLRRGEWKQTDEGVVCAYGAFDLLHPGHIRLFEQARDFGDILVVAVQSDAVVRASAASARGDGAPERPITPAAERAEIVAALSAVDFAAVVEDPLTAFLQTLRPDVYVCGEDTDRQPDSANPADAIGLESALEKIPSKLVRLALEPGYSATRLIERISGKRA